LEAIPAARLSVRGNVFIPFESKGDKYHHSVIVIELESNN